MLMSEINGEWVVDTDDGGYRVEIDPGDHLILVAGAPTANRPRSSSIRTSWPASAKSTSSSTTARPGANFGLPGPA